VWVDQKFASTITIIIANKNHIQKWKRARSGDYPGCCRRFMSAAVCFCGSGVPPTGGEMPLTFSLVQVYFGGTTIPATSTHPPNAGVVSKAFVCWAGFDLLYVVSMQALSLSPIVWLSVRPAKLWQDLIGK
jgi:hypothetical protein